LFARENDFIVMTLKEKKKIDVFLLLLDEPDRVSVGVSFAQLCSALSLCSAPCPAYPPILWRLLSFFFIRHALRAGLSIDEIFDLTKIDRWFLTQIKEIVDFEQELASSTSVSTAN